MSARTILVVDDEPSVRRTLERSVSSLGYRPVPAGDPGAAYAALREQPVHAVLLDVHLSHATGDAVYTKLLDQWPELQGRIAFMSGDIDSVRQRWSPELRAAPTLAKPFELSALGTLLAALTAPALGA